MKSASCCSGLFVLQVSCFHSRVAEDFLLGCNPASLGDQLTLNGDSILVSSSRVFLNSASEDEPIWLSQNVRYQVPSDVMSHPRRTQPSYAHHVTAVCALWYSEICLVLQQHLHCVCCVLRIPASCHVTLISSSRYSGMCILLEWCLV